MDFTSLVLAARPNIKPNSAKAYATSGRVNVEMKNSPNTRNLTNLTNLLTLFDPQPQYLFFFQKIEKIYIPVVVV